jgi:hypothetical protein
MVFYQILQFGKHRCVHHDELATNEKEMKEVCNRIVAKVKEVVAKGEMVEGQFEVIVCDETGQELDIFLSGTDYTY